MPLYGAHGASLRGINPQDPLVLDNYTNVLKQAIWLTILHEAGNNVYKSSSGSRSYHISGKALLEAALQHVS